MDCDTATELLPWHLNGSLTAAEQAAVEAHLESCPRCRGELAESREGWLLFGGHPTSRQLVGYASGDRRNGGDLIEAHLDGCTSCAHELALIHDSRHRILADQPRSRPDGLRIAARWRLAAVAATIVAVVGISGWLGSRRLDAGAGQVAARQRVDELEGEIARMQAAAAPAAPVGERLESLAATSAELAERVAAGERQVAELERQLQELSRPRLNVAIADLWPEGSVLRGPGAAAAAVPADRGAVTLILNSELPDGAPAARLAVRDAAGRRIHDLDGVRRDPDGGFTLSLPTASLAAGVYAIELYDRGGQRLESFRFTLD